MLHMDKNAAVFVVSHMQLTYSVKSTCITSCFYSSLSQTLRSQYYQDQKTELLLLLLFPKFLLMLSSLTLTPSFFCPFTFRILSLCSTALFYLHFKIQLNLLFITS